MEIETLTQLLLTYKYYILFPLALIEGPIVSICAGIFVKLGYFNLIPSFIIMILGDFVPDCFFYFVGYGNRNRALVTKYTSKLNDESLIIKLWKHQPIKTLFMSKLAFGLSPALLVTAGIAQVPLRFYIKWGLIITLIQHTLFMSVGYWIGYSYKFIQNIHYFGILITIVVVVFFFVSKKVRQKATEKIEDMEQKEL